jgi:hypothetical protein
MVTKIDVVAIVLALLTGCTPVRVGTLTMVCLGLCARLEQSAEATLPPPSQPTECAEGP